jgi:hypothetical protein
MLQILDFGELYAKRFGMPGAPAEAADQPRTLN